MAQRTTRKTLINVYESSKLALHRLDINVAKMVELAEGRSDPVTEMAPILIDGHDTLRRLWTALREQL